MTKNFKKITFLTILFVGFIFSIKTYASNFDFIASNFVNKLYNKNINRTCDIQGKEFDKRANKFEVVNEMYLKNNKIDYQKRLLISKLLKTIISKLKSKKNYIKYSCIEKKTIEKKNKNNKKQY